MDVIFDIDGTLANCDHRVAHVQGDVKDWDAFYATIADDKPIAPMITLLKSMAGDKFSESRILFATGRSENHREATAAWLSKHLGYTAWSIKPLLWMRAADDRRPDFVVKMLMLEDMKAKGYNPELVFEDRKSVVDMWREQGLICCQVAPGDF